jgi:hypothetical protein
VQGRCSLHACCALRIKLQYAQSGSGSKVTGQLTVEQSTLLWHDMTEFAFKPIDYVGFVAYIFWYALMT